MKDTANEGFARHVQHVLMQTGDYPGPLDGWAGARTRAAFDAAMARAGRAGAPVAAPAAPVAAPMIRQGSAGHPVREIIVHCSATRPEWFAGRSLQDKIHEIDRWHRMNGWQGIGYHWLIDRDGKIAAGRPETQIGAHVVGRNSGTIGVCLIGGHGSSERDPFNRNFTADQDKALRQLIREISNRTQITTVSGHNQYAAKACPGFHVPSWI
jgi:hypothetical protein